MNLFFGPRTCNTWHCEAERAARTPLWALSLGAARPPALAALACMAQPVAADLARGCELPKPANAAMAPFCVATSAPSTSGRACAPTASAAAAGRLRAAAWLPQQASCSPLQQGRWRRRRRGSGGGSGIAASSSEKPDWFQALEETAELDEDVARLLASAKGNPDAVRTRMQQGGCHAERPGWLPLARGSERAAGWQQLPACLNTSVLLHVRVSTSHQSPCMLAAAGLAVSTAGRQPGTLDPHC